MTITIEKKVIVVGAAILLVTTAFVVGYVGATHSLPVFKDINRLARSASAPLSAGYDKPDQLMLVYYAKSTCAWCNDPAMPSLLNDAMRLVADAADAKGLGFVSMGVAMDLAPEPGLAYLNKVGRFNQVAAGYGWANAGAIDFRGMPSINSTPQIVVLRRTLASNVQGNATLRTVRDLSIVARKVGFGEIQDWVGRGAPVPAAALSTNVQRLQPTR